MNENTSTSKMAMVIDDNNIDLYITARVIRKINGIGKVLEFSSGETALQYLKEVKSDLSLIPNYIFVDIYMPQMSGFEFMEAYHFLPEEIKKHCKCYIVSSSIDEKDINRAYGDENVVAFREKPVSASFLENIINNTL